MSDSKYRPKRRHDNGAPRWCTNYHVVRPERQNDRLVLKRVLRWTRDELQDVPELGKGNKPNADWEYD